MPLFHIQIVNMNRCRALCFMVTPWLLLYCRLLSAAGFLCVVNRHAHNAIGVNM